MKALLWAILMVLMADPNIVLRENNPDPYAHWVLFVTKCKKLILPWYWSK